MTGKLSPPCFNPLESLIRPLDFWGVLWTLFFLYVQLLCCTVCRAVLAFCFERALKKISTNYAAVCWRTTSWVCQQLTRWRKTVSHQGDGLPCDRAFVKIFFHDHSRLVPAKLSRKRVGRLRGSCCACNRCVYIVQRLLLVEFTMSSWLSIFIIKK